MADLYTEVIAVLPLPGEQMTEGAYDAVRRLLAPHDVPLRHSQPWAPRPHDGITMPPLPGVVREVQQHLGKRPPVHACTGRPDCPMHVGQALAELGEPTTTREG